MATPSPWTMCNYATGLELRERQLEGVLCQSAQVSVLGQGSPTLICWDWHYIEGAGREESVLGDMPSWGGGCLRCLHDLDMLGLALFLRGWDRGQGVIRHAIFGGGVVGNL